MKVVKATAQVLNTLWQYRDLRTIYKKVSTLELMRTVYTYIVGCVRVVWISTEKKDMPCKYQKFRRLKKKSREQRNQRILVFFLPNRMDGTKTISSLQCQHLKGTGSSPSPPCPPALFRCPRSTTLVGSSSALEIDTASETGKPLEFNVKICFFFLFTAASATSSPAMLGIKEHRDTIRDYQRAQSTMQFYNYQGDNTIHKKQYTGTQTKLFKLLTGCISSQKSCSNSICGRL